METRDMRQCQYCYNNGVANPKTNNHDQDYCSVNMMMFIDAPCEKFEALTCSPTAVVNHTNASKCTICTKFFGSRCDGVLDEHGDCEKFEGIRYSTDSDTPVNIHDSKPVNHKEGKDRMLILFEYFPDALPMVAEVFYKALETGKYERNTFGAVPVEELLEKLLRHIRDHRTGEVINEADFGLYHSAHMVANGLMALQNELASK